MRRQLEQTIAWASLIISSAAALSAAAAAIFMGLQWREVRTYNRLLLKPSVDFYTEDDAVEPVVGIKIMNGGPGPAVIKKLTYFVDRKPVRDYDEASDYGKLNTDPMRYYDFDEDDTLSINEAHWLFYRTTKNKKDLDHFIDFIDMHLAIEVSYCSLDGACWKKCSTKDRC